MQGIPAASLCVSIRSGMVKALIIAGLCVAIFGTAAYFGYRLYVPVPAFEKPGTAHRHVILRSDQGIPAFERCMQLRKTGNLQQAQAELENFVRYYPDSSRIQNAKQALGEINIAQLFSDAPGPGKNQYTIEKGDTIGSIVRKTKAPAELIMRINRIEDPTKLHIGQVLNISQPGFSLKISRGEKTVTLLDAGKFFKQYGVQAWNAPAPKNAVAIQGRVTGKIAWKDGRQVGLDSKDLNGSGRWISLSVPGYALYTVETEESGGTPKPPGGLGMNPEDMEELSILLSKGTPVTIQ
jgi:LysM repeat protein